MPSYSFKSQKKILLLYIISLVSLLFFRDVLDYEINKYVFAFLVIAVSVVANYYTLLIIILFTLPLMCGLPGNYFLPIWAFLILYHQISLNSINQLAVLFAIVILIWEFTLHALFSLELPLINFLSYSSSIIILSLLITDKSILDFHTPVLAFCLGCCVLLSIIFIVYMRDPSLLYTDGGVRMGGDAYLEEGEMSLRTNPNNIGYLSTSSIACLLAMFNYRKVRFLPFLLMLSISFVCGMYSISRTWALLVTLSFIIYFMIQKRNIVANIVVLSIFVLVVALYLSNNEAIINSFTDRFTGDNIETAGDRTVLFSKFNEFLFQHPVNFLFGTSALMYKEVTGIMHSTHNTLQQIWLSYGFLGFSLFVYVYIIQLKKYYVKGQFISCLPMLMIFIFLQTIQFLNPQNGMYPMIAAFFVMKNVKQQPLYYDL